jgi:hypothetical protein
MLPEGPVFSSGRVKVFGWNSRGFWVWQELGTNRG